MLGIKLLEVTIICKLFKPFKQLLLLTLQHGDRIPHAAGMVDKVRGGEQPGLQRHLLHRDDAQALGLRILQIHQRRLQRLRRSHRHPQVRLQLSMSSLVITIRRLSNKKLSLKKV